MTVSGAWLPDRGPHDGAGAADQAGAVGAVDPVATAAAEGGDLGGPADTTAPVVSAGPATAIEPAGSAGPEAAATLAAGTRGSPDLGADAAEPADSVATDVPGGPRIAWVVALVLAAIVGALVRWWQISGRDALGWNDSADFVAGSQAPWTSLELWAGPRPPAAAVMLKLVGGGDDAYVRAQAAIATACWAVLAASVTRVVAGRARAWWLAPVAVVALSVTTPVTMWERSVLSESLAISSLALVVAAGLQLAGRVTVARVVALIAALAGWLATRDSNAVVALLGGAALVAGLGVAAWRSGRWSRPLAGLGAGTLALGLVVLVASSHGERHAFPMRNVYEVRVLPYPDRVEWFADRGMPQAEVFAGPGARVPYVEAGMPPVLYVADDDAELRQWLEWVESDGRAAFAWYVASHPQYLVTEPLRTPERAFNNALGDRQFYQPLDMRRVPLVDTVLAPPTLVVLMVAALVGGWAIGRQRWTPVLAAGVVVAVLAVPHGLVAWHSDGMETARHLVVPALQLHVGVLLMAVGVLVGDPATGQRSGRPRSRLGRSSPPAASTSAPVT